MVRVFMRYYFRKSLTRKRNWKHRADMLMEEGRFDEAEARLKKVLRYQEDNLAALTRIARISERKNDWEAAAARWERVVEVSSGKAQPAQARKKLKQAYIEWGGALITAGRLNEAQACCRKALSLDAGILFARTDLTDDEFTRTVALSTDIGQIDRFINALVSERAAIDKAYLDKYELMNDSLKASDREDRHKKALRALLLAHKIDELTFSHMRDAGKFRHPLVQASSFRVNMIRRRRMKQLGPVPDRWLTSSKAAVYSFTDSIGIIRPATIVTAKFEDIPRRDGIVIKPLHGNASRGVYLIISENRIRSVYRYKDLSGWEELEKCVREDITNGIINDDVFNVEEYVYDDTEKIIPARDLKFYTFYGEVGLVLEVSRYPVRENWWWSAEGKPVETGKYELAKSTGYGITPEQIEIAKNISLQIPAPFMRIDFLKGHDQIYFTGFCSAPGGFENFDKQTDKRLGDLYLKSEIRLQNDLLNGKDFAHMRAINDKVRTNGPVGSL